VSVTSTQEPGLIVPPLREDEIRMLYAAANLLRSLTRHAAGYSAPVHAARGTILDVRQDAIHRFPRPDADGLYQLPPLTAGEHQFLLVALANLRDGLGHLSVYAVLEGDQAAVTRLLSKLG
jgi:hypothetical protein